MTVPHSGRGRGGPWKLAPCLIAMEAEADRIAPNRRRTSDGSIGDQAHAARKSDHNPDEEGATDWVDALDISHDPANGMDIHARARTIADRQDQRIDYIISNNRIWSQAKPYWRAYTGSNPHTLHAHFSIRDSGRFDTSPWFSGVPMFPTAPTPPVTPEQLTRLIAGQILTAVEQMPYLHPRVPPEQGPWVEVLQKALNVARRAGLVVDGVYGQATTLHVIAWQEQCREFGLEVRDTQGECGPYTKWWLAAAVRNVRDGR